MLSSYTSVKTLLAQFTQKRMIQGNKFGVSLLSIASDVRLITPGDHFSYRFDQSAIVVFINLIARLFVHASLQKKLIFIHRNLIASLKSCSYLNNSHGNPPTTTGNPTFAECWRRCREQYIEHSAKLQIAECLPKDTRQKNDTRQRFALPSACLQTLGKPAFAECHAGSTRHTASRVRSIRSPRPLPVTAVIVCRVPRSWHLANTITSRGR